MIDFWTFGHFRSPLGEPVSIRKMQGGSFTVGTPEQAFFYHKTGSASRPLYVVTLPSHGMKVCEAPKLKDAKAQAERLIPRIAELCQQEGNRRQERTFSELVQRAEALGVNYL